MFEIMLGRLSRQRKEMRDEDFEAFTEGFGNAAYQAFPSANLKDKAGSSLFKRILSKTGPLSASEIYGFNPALVAGGRMKLENLEKVNIFDHLAYLRQLAKPELPFSDIDISTLM
jgi:hypothetical protein